MFSFIPESLNEKEANMASLEKVLTLFSVALAKSRYPRHIDSSFAKKRFATTP